MGYQCYFLSVVHIIQQLLMVISFKCFSRVEHKSLIVIKDHSREHGRNTLMAEHLKQASESEGLRPRGAVISLALGLTITAITAALIACRLRVVRRRGRRHGPYAHDADYLVNGMYL